MSRPYVEYLHGKEKKEFMVGVFLRHPHFDDTGWDTEVVTDYRLMFAESAEEMIAMAREVLVPPNIDPALVSIVVWDPSDERRYRHETG
jgi:hypothetical protein